jgi:hypothetical protein
MSRESHSFSTLGTLISKHTWARWGLVFIPLAGKKSVTTRSHEYEHIDMELPEQSSPTHSEFFPYSCVLQKLPKAQEAIKIVHVYFLPMYI